MQALGSMRFGLQASVMQQHSKQLGALDQQHPKPKAEIQQQQQTTDSAKQKTTWWEKLLNLFRHNGTGQEQRNIQASVRLMTQRFAAMSQSPQKSVQFQQEGKGFKLEVKALHNGNMLKVIATPEAILSCYTSDKGITTSQEHTLTKEQAPEVFAELLKQVFEASGIKQSESELFQAPMRSQTSELVGNQQQQQSSGMGSNSSFKLWPSLFDNTAQQTK